MSSAARRVLLVVGGGIAAYRSLDLARELRRRGLLVRCVLTAGAREFVTPLSAASLSGDKVFTELFDLTDEAAMGHIELSRDAALVLVAPATANLIGKAANGLADDLASTLLLATDKRALWAPAMNLRMWLHPAVQRNVARLKADGAAFVGPDDGAMACGEHGPGRLARVEAIAGAALALLAGDTTLALPAGVGRAPTGASSGPSGADSVPSEGATPFSNASPARGPLAGRRAIVTSGPTHEPIDPVRYLANRSSGRQGHAIAAALAALGAEVTLVSGPVTVPDPPGVRVARVGTAREMAAAVEAALPADVAVMAAAVADWRAADAGAQKIKKGAGAPPVLALVENPDVLAGLARRAEGRPRLVVGFAAETERVVEHARAKLARKGCDLVVANDVGAGSGVAGGVMGGARNRVHLVSASGEEAWPEMDKDEVARRLAARIADLLAGEAPPAGGAP